MTWDYLRDGSTDYRYHFLKKVLGKKVKGKHIIDINCMEAKMADFFDGYASYLGNDLNYFDPSPKCTFFDLPDDKFVEKVKACDILLVLGYPDTKNHPHTLESPTIDDSVLKLTTNYKPQYLVVEGITRYEKGMLDLISACNYKIIDREFSPTQDQSMLLDRILYLCSPNQ